MSFTRKDTGKVEATVTIRELGEALNRKPATIRDWERRGILPEELVPVRNSRRWRCWTPEQVDGIQTWMDQRGIYPGKGLPHYRPTPEQLKAHVEGLRKPRKAAIAA
jgi:MerR HTH family regulatory protein